jgi:hypothetical protein
MSQRCAFQSLLGYPLIWQGSPIFSGWLAGRRGISGRGEHAEGSLGGLAGGVKGQFCTLNGFWSQSSVAAGVAGRGSQMSVVVSGGALQVGGARAGCWWLRMIAAATAWMTSGRVLTAMMRRRPPHGHSRMSTRNTRWSSSAHTMRFGRSGATGRIGVASRGTGRTVSRRDEAAE